jgi:hypothetical protein
MINDNDIERMMQPDPVDEQRGWKFITMDDMPENVRACRLASLKHDWEHQSNCPSCLDNCAENTLMDAAWWREEADRDPAPYPDGTRRTPEQCAAELEAEAAELRAKAAKIRAARLTERT